MSFVEKPDNNSYEPILSLVKLDSVGSTSAGSPDLKRKSSTTAEQLAAAAEEAKRQAAVAAEEERRIAEEKAR